MLTFLFTINLSHTLKMLHHEPRPYFDDPTLLDSGLIDCAGEFGNPSAHAHTSIFFTLTIYNYYKDKYNKSFCKLNRFF